MKRILPLCIITLALGFMSCQSNNPTTTPDPQVTTPTAPPQQDENLMERSSDGQQLPRFEAAETCPFQLPSNLSTSNTRCGYVVVRESRYPRSSRTIKVAVLVVKNLAGIENRVANIYLTGGPGGTVQGTILGLQGQNLKTFAGQNDLIIFDQRGVGNSQPRLECPSAQSAKARLQSALSLSVNTKSSDPVLDEIVNQGVAENLKCRDALVAKGYQLTAFNTRESAGDVNDIRKALSYKKLNLWGASYGTYLAQIVMRDYRRVVRAVNLEAIIDPSQNWLARAPLAFDRSRIEVFKACAADAACNTAYPNLAQTFDDLIVELNTNQPEIQIPVSATEFVTARVNGDLFFRVLNQLLYSPSFLPFVPIYVNVTKAGNYRAFASILSQLFLGGDGTNSDGMYLSVVCSDTAQFSNEYQINRILDRVTPAYRRLLGASPLAIEKTCRSWGVPADIFARFPVISDIPTLLQVGFFDPITPPSYAEAVNSRLFNKNFVFYPAGAHGASAYPSAEPGDQGECAQGILAAFFENPEAEINTTCAEKPISFFVNTARARTADPFPMPKIDPASSFPRF
jgi:pimeloyl-ACP methyl ester carboxylesterase